MGGPHSACLASDRPLVAILKANHVVQVWNWEQRAMEQEISTSTPPEIAVSCAAFVDDDRKLLMNWVSADEKTRGLYEWDLTTGKPTRSWPYSGPGTSPQSTVSADGRWCLVSWSGNPFSGRLSDKGPVVLIDLDSGIERNLAGAVSWCFDGASFSADGRSLAAPGITSTTIWELQTFQLVRTIKSAVSATFSRDSQRLAFGDGSLRDASSGELVLELEPRGSTFRMEFSPDDNVLAAWTQFNALHFWRAPSWSEIEAAERAGEVQERRHF
jgi:WD40 repeat protein